MVSKIKTLAEAVSLIKDGDQIATGGWTVIRRPMAVVYEMIRQKKKKLHLVCGTPGTDSDLLIAAGCVAIGEQAYVGHEKYGHAYNFRRAIEAGPEATGVIYDDNSLLVSWLRLQASAMGVPFLPTMSLHGSDILNPEYDTLKHLRGKNPKLAKEKFVRMKDPFFEGREVILVPAAKPDVAIIHAHAASPDGTAYINNCPLGDRITAMSAPILILTVEKIVSREEICNYPSANIVPGMYTTAIVEVPYGAHPTQMPNYYDNDPLFYKKYQKASESKDTFDRWIDEWIYGIKDHDEYIKKIGKECIEKIKADPNLGYNPNLERMV